MSLSEKRIFLPNSPTPGASIPVIGFGTWQAGPGEVAKAVEYALREAGYRNIDAAFAYLNQKGAYPCSFYSSVMSTSTGSGKMCSSRYILFAITLEVGQGIKASGVPRSEIFITSKIWSTYHRRVEENVNLILEELGTDYVDLLLMHWPFPMNPNGNHPLFPMRENGTRDHDDEWDIKDTWKQLEAIQRSGKLHMHEFQVL